MNTCDHYNNVKTNASMESLKTCSQTCACDPSDLYGYQSLSLSLVLKTLKNEDFKDFEAITEKIDFFTQ